MSSAKAARKAVADALVGVAGLSSSRVLAYEPAPGGFPRPKGVSCSTAGMSDTDHLVAVRCYVDTSRGADVAADDMDDLMSAVEDQLPGEYPRSSWETGWVADDQTFVATCTLSVPREDF